MFRVLLAVALGATVAGCGLNTRTLSTGFTDTPTADTGALASRRDRQAALGGDVDGRSPRAVRENRRVASLDDRAPSGESAKAPKGALADRDYSGTKLNPETARDLINQYRKAKGLKAVKLDAKLTQAARAHSQDLAKWDRISHYGSDGSNPWDRVKRAGYNARVAAENVGTGQVTFEEVLKGWQNSPGHNKNLLLADVEHMGLALVHDPKTEFKTFWTLVVGSGL